MRCPCYVSPAIQKALGWIGLAIGGAGTLLFVWAILTEDWPPYGDLWPLLWPAGTFLLASACASILRRAYRLEPTPGRNQLVLADLICTLLLFGSVLYVGSRAKEDVALLRYWGIPALVIAGCYLAGVTRAARLGLRGSYRYVVGTANALTILGCLGVGALVVLLIHAVTVDGIDLSAKLMVRLLSLDTSWGQPGWLFYALRVALCALPLGLLLGLVLRLTVRSTPEPTSEVPADPPENP